MRDGASTDATAAEDRFRALIEHSADGIAALAADGTFRYASSSIVRACAHTSAELTGQNAFALIHPDDRDGARARFRETLEACGRVVRTEFRVRHRDGGFRWVEAIATNLLHNPAVQAVLSSYRDITDRKHAEQALRHAHERLERRVAERTRELEAANRALRAEIAERQQAEAALAVSRAQLAAIIASAIDAIVSIDDEYRIVLFNQAAEEMFQRRADTVIGQPLHVLIPTRFRSGHQQSVQSFADSGVRGWRCMAGGYVTGLRADGEEFLAESVVSRTHVAGRTLYTAILRDVSQRIRAEEEIRRSREQLRALAARVESVREEERSRIARDVHDELGQALTGLKIDLSALATKAGDLMPEVGQRIEAMMRVVRQTIDFVRALGAQLRPAILDDVGLAAAIEWQTQEFQSRTGVVCRFVSALTDDGLPADVTTALFRILQETLTNVARHAHATFVHVRLERREGAVVLVVEDNGRGIAPGEIENVRSLGLVGMRERALLLGGDLAIVGRAGRGTCVTVRIPLAHGPAAPADRAPAGDGP